MSTRTDTSQDAEGLSTEVHPARIPVLENYLRENAIDFEFFPEWPVEEVNVPRSRGNQARATVKGGLLPVTVTRYKEAYERGAVLPAVILHQESRSYVLDDGNHRHESAILAEQKTLPAYLVKAADEALYALRKWCNSTLNGELPPEDERVKAAIHFIDQGMTQEAAAAEMNLTVGQVTRAWIIESVNRRLAVTGVKRYEQIPGTIRTKMNTVKSNPVLKRLADLVLTYKTPSSDFNEIIKAAAKYGSEEEALAYLDEKEPQLKASFQERGGGKFQPKSRKGTPYAKALGFAHLEGILKMNTTQVSRAIRTPEEAKVFSAKCLAVADRLMVIAEEVGG